MIEIRLIVKDGEVLDSFDADSITFDEAGVCVYRLEQFIQKLTNIDFENRIEVKKEND